MSPLTENDCERDVAMRVLGLAATFMICLSSACGADDPSPTKPCSPTQQSKDGKTKKPPSLFPLTATATIIWSGSSKENNRDKEVFSVTTSETVLFAIQTRQRVDVESGTDKNPKMAEFFVYSAEQDFHASGRVHLSTMKLRLDRRGTGLLRKHRQTGGFLDVMLDSILEDSTTAENVSMKLKSNALWYQFRVNHFAKKFRNQRQGLLNLSQTIEGISVQATDTLSKPGYDFKQMSTKNIDEFIAKVAEMNVKKRTWDLP